MSPKPEKKVAHLDLDEVFGVARPIHVKWGGKTHELTRPEGLGAKQLAQLEALQKQSGLLKDFGEDITDEDAALLENTIESAVALIGPTLPLKQLPFMAKARILLFYQQEVGIIDAEGNLIEDETPEEDPKAEQAGNE